MITSTMFGILIWALCAAHGAGSLIHTGPSQRGSVLHWNTVYGLQSILGASASGCLGQSGKETPFSCDSQQKSNQMLMVSFLFQKIGHAMLKLIMRLFSGKLSPRLLPYVSLLSVV